jgi:WD40 repeat protein
MLEHPESGPVLGVEIGADHVSVWEFGAVPKLKLKQSVKATAAALSTVGDALAVADERGRVTAWSLTSGQALGKIDSNHAGRIGCLAFSANGRWLALPIEGNSVGIWFVGEASIPLKIAGHPEGTHRFRFLGDDRFATAGLGSSLKLWNLSTLREEHSFLGHSARITCLAATSDLRTLVSGSTDGEVRFWDLRTGQELIAATRHRGPVFAAEFSGDSRFLLSGSGLRGRGELAFWDAEVE